MAMKCSRSPDGKHKWAHRIETQIVSGRKTQVRKCEKCNYEEELVEDIRGRKRWKPV